MSVCSHDYEKERNIETPLKEDLPNNGINPSDDRGILPRLPTIPIPDGPACFASEVPAQPLGKVDGDIGPPPDGGREAWLCVLGAFFAVFCIFGFSMFIPLLCGLD